MVAFTSFIEKLWNKHFHLLPLSVLSFFSVTSLIKKWSHLLSLSRNCEINTFTCFLLSARNLDKGSKCYTYFPYRDFFKEFLEKYVSYFLKCRRKKFWAQNFGPILVKIFADTSLGLKNNKISKFSKMSVTPFIEKWAV